MLQPGVFRFHPFSLELGVSLFLRGSGSVGSRTPRVVQSPGTPYYNIQNMRDVVWVNDFAIKKNI